MYIERRFKFPDKQHFVNKTVKFTAALPKYVKLAAFQSQETIMMFPELGCFPLCQRFRKFRSEFKWKGPFRFLPTGIFGITSGGGPLISVGIFRSKFAVPFLTNRFFALI